MAESSEELSKILLSSGFLAQGGMNREGEPIFPPASSCASSGPLLVTSSWWHQGLSLDLFKRRLLGHGCGGGLRTPLLL